MLKKLYQKSQIWFAVAWIIAYVVLASLGDNLSEEIALSRIKIQTKEEEYKRNADIVIENIVDEELEEKIKDALNKLKI